MHNVILERMEHQDINWSQAFQSNRELICQIQKSTSALMLI